MRLRVAVRQRSDYEKTTSTYRTAAILHAVDTDFAGGLQGIKQREFRDLKRIKTMDMTFVPRGC